MIIIQAGDHSQSFTESFIAGRGADFDIPDEYASPRHARFSRSGDGWVVEDLGSSNGTWFITSRTQHRIYGSHRLAKGDQIRIGRTNVIVVPE